MLKAKFLGNIHCPPRGVVAEPLHSGPCKRFQDSNCPREVFDLMNRKGAVTAYHDMMDEISADENTRDRLGVLKLKAIDTIVERFRPRFSKCGVKVVVCVADYRCNLYRWIEFVDSGAITYISPYNFKNTAGPKLKTALSTIKFQKGVAVEEFRQAFFGKRGRLVKQTPKHVEIMIREKGLQEEYERLIQDCIHEGVGGFLGRWDIGKLREVIQHYRPLFQDKGVALFLCHTQEHVPSVEGGERIEYFRWMELVDRNKLQYLTIDPNTMENIAMKIRVVRFYSSASERLILDIMRNIIKAWQMYALRVKSLATQTLQSGIVHGETGGKHNGEPSQATKYIGQNCKH